MVDYTMLLALMQVLIERTELIIFNTYIFILMLVCL